MKLWFIAPLEEVELWPSREGSIWFMGHELFLRPMDGDALPDVRLQYESPEEESSAVETIFQFLSMWSWWHHAPARVGFCQFSSAPIRVGASNTFSFQTGFPTNQDVGPVPATPEARLAVALYREACNVNSVPYEFLGYFKILNITYTTAKAQKAWINSTILLLTEHKAVTRLQALAANTTDIGDYLYASGRCAVAHAATAPVANPDDRGELIRLHSDLPVIRALAEYLIEYELGVKWRHSGHPKFSALPRV
jgi:hypothetical protein